MWDHIIAVVLLVFVVGSVVFSFLGAKAKKVVIAVLILLFVGWVPTASAKETTWEWTGTNIALEVAYQAINILDWKQTRYVASRNWELDVPCSEIRSDWSNQVTCKKPVYEKTEWLHGGSHPSVQTLDNVILGLAIAHPLIMATIPSNLDLFGLDIPLRDIVSTITITDKAIAVTGNWKLGLTYNRVF